MDKVFDIVTTKGGDGGQTSLLGGVRLPKDDFVFEALGTVDELNSFIGLARSSCHIRMVRLSLRAIQKRLLTVGTELALIDSDAPNPGMPQIIPSDVSRLETLESWFMAKTPIQRQFILPGDAFDSACLDVARTICRRAERQVVRLAHQRETSGLALVMKFLNRLSDLLFVMARYTTHQQTSNHQPR